LEQSPKKANWDFAEFCERRNKRILEAEERKGFTESETSVPNKPNSN
jgi:hypothetical protein